MTTIASYKNNCEPSMPFTDQELVSLLLKGNNNAIIQLLQQLRPIVKLIREKKLRAFDLDETDLVHDIFIFLQKDNFKTLRSFRFESRLSTWLFMVSYRFVLKQYQKLLKESAFKMTLLDGIVLYVKDETTQDYLIRAELLDAISKLVDKREQQVLLLIIQDFEAEDIARQLRTTVNNIYTIKSRAIKKLKNMLNE